MLIELSKKAAQGFMKRELKRSLAAFLVMIAAVGLAHALAPEESLAQQLGAIQLDSAVPIRFGGWKEVRDEHAAVVNPQQVAFVASIYAETLLRTYVDSKGNRVMLSIAYSKEQGKGRGIHYPEVCYPAQGFQIVDSSQADILVAGRMLPVKRLLARQGDRVEPITYWVMVGEQPSRGGVEQKISQMRYRVQGVIPDGLIFRVSSIGGDTSSAYRLQSEFVNALIPEIAGRAQSRIAGR